MKLMIIGSHFCPNTLYEITKCKDAELDIQFVDLSGSLQDLKRFLALHEHEDLYAAHREQSGEADYVQNGAIGLPCFLLENGHKTLNLCEALQLATEIKGGN